MMAVNVNPLMNVINSLVSTIVRTIAEKVMSVIMKKLIDYCCGQTPILKFSVEFL